MCTQIKIEKERKEKKKKVRKKERKKVRKKEREKVFCRLQFIFCKMKTGLSLGCHGLHGWRFLDRYCYQ